MSAKEENDLGSYLKVIQKAVGWNLFGKATNREGSCKETEMVADKKICPARFR